MKTLTFKSNINCNGCLATVTPILNGEKGIDSWNVDLQHEDRILTVETEELTAEAVQQTVSKAGFTTTPIND